mmetsp:Transcript_4107/g.13124  ORF Transcript_4107/g.13124 Transcript_4107/m.13124 type:complete len:250 (-) Transcript_4107:1926-2675(-)
MRPRRARGAALASHPAKVAPGRSRLLCADCADSVRARDGCRCEERGRWTIHRHSTRRRARKGECRAFFGHRQCGPRGCHAAARCPRDRCQLSGRSGSSSAVEHVHLRSRPTACGRTLGAEHDGLCVRAMRARLLQAPSRRAQVHALPRGQHATRRRGRVVYPMLRTHFSAIGGPSRVPLVPGADDVDHSIHRVRRMRQWHGPRLHPRDGEPGNVQAMPPLRKMPAQCDHPVHDDLERWHLAPVARCTYD